jgi:hypothetical protein
VEEVLQREEQMVLPHAVEEVPHVAEVLQRVQGEVHEEPLLLHEEPVLPEVEVVREVLPEVQVQRVVGVQRHDAVLLQMLVSQVLV